VTTLDPEQFLYTVRPTGQLRQTNRTANDPFWRVLLRNSDLTQRKECNMKVLKLEELRDYALDHKEESFDINDPLG
jgi:hypothetical protein